MNTTRPSSLLLTAAVALLCGIFGGAIAIKVIKNTPSESPPEQARTVEIRGSEEERVVDMVKNSSPSVVSIIVSKDLATVYRRTGNVFPFDDIFDQLGLPFEFRTTPAPRQQENTQEQPEKKKESKKQKVGGGTGFVISEDGLIMTNRHVVSEEDADYTVVFGDGKEYKATVLAKDQILDLAIVKIDAKNLTPLPLGDSDAIQIGQTVIAIGNTLAEYKNTVTRGVVSGIDREVRAMDGRGQSEVIQEAIQTDAAINPGNSGGPLLNLKGEAIGINTAVNREGQSIGFAIPINLAKRSVESVKKYGKIVRPWIGVRYTLIDSEFVKNNNLPIDHGAMIIGDPTQKVIGVIPKSPADKAGLRDGDIILELDGKKIDQSHSLAGEVARHAPGDEVTLKVFSKGDTREVKVKLEEFQEQK
ncbi:trypsin-like peptidase domain-containing protein [Candidatus Uhrbacteria bacterium]|nr:trypsin-like peptidase domain-containing protein [Candidatus Uhrbacteria bacterium]